MKYLRTVNDVMTHAVVSVDRSAPVHDIVGTMQRWGFSSLSVDTAEGRAVGVVSEDNLPARAEGSDESHTVTTGQLMTAPPATVTKDATIAGAARLLAKGHFTHGRRQSSGPAEDLPPPRHGHRHLRARLSDDGLTATLGRKSGRRTR
ncbi:cyclic nucleotide-binding/CBS domain-containing protein [Streptomyces sp. NPDC056254]|uniref:CBS domain-containing protein n=1 Tax=Streptomyces sp. NPDC056254 TaxID=3345763 RepID=UPI0035E07A6A